MIWILRQRSSDDLGKLSDVELNERLTAASKALSDVQPQVLFCLNGSSDGVGANGLAER